MSRSPRARFVSVALVLAACGGGSQGSAPGLEAPLSAPAEAPASDRTGESAAATVSDLSTSTTVESPEQLVREFLSSLSSGDWEDAARLSGMSPNDVREAAGLAGGPPEFAATEAAALEIACFAGALCIEPAEVNVTERGVEVAFEVQAGMPQLLSTFVVTDGNVAGMPPFTFDQRASRCNVIELEGAPEVEAEQSAATQAPGVEWNGVADESKSVFLAWAGDGAGYFGAPQLPVDIPLPRLGGSASLYSIEAGFAADVILADACGRYTVWTYASDVEPSYLISILELMKRRDGGS